MPSQFMTTLEVARLLGVMEWRIRYVLRKGTVRPPARLGNGAYVWQLAEVRGLAAALDVPCPAMMDEVKQPETIVIVQAK